MLLTERWSDFIAGLEFDDLPEEVVWQTKMYILDNIGCALGGYAIDWGKRVVDVGVELGGRTEATVIGSGDRLHCVNAAYVNGKLSNILDFDETLYNNRHIGGVPVFPALSAGERLEATGKDIILATALAYDFGARCSICGSSFRPDPQKGVVVSDNGTLAFNTFAAAISAAKVFKFNEEQIKNTLGIVAYYAPGAIESKFVFTPPSNFNKYGDIGWFCSSGVMAGICTQNGYIGDPSVFDGPRGLTSILGAPDFDNDTFIAELGKRWYILDAGIKPYPTCRWFHTGIKLFEEIRTEHGLLPEDIERITVNIHPFAIDLPTFIAAAQWATSASKDIWLSIDSLSYALACTVFEIPPGPDWGREETLASPKIAEMTKKVFLGEHPEAMKMTGAWKGHPGKIFSQPPTSIEVVTKRGRFTAESNDIPGDSWNPRSKMSDEEIITKFRNNALPILNTSLIDKVIETVCNLDKVETTGELTSLLA